MRILLKQLTLLDKQSPYNQDKVSILIENGIISKIGKSIRVTKNVKSIDCKGAYASIGWLDIGTQIGEPGYEHRETLETVAAAAARGGFTELASFPNTHPIIQTKSEVQYILNRTEKSLVDFHPIGAVSKDCNGEELSEMMDMHSAGAIAFSDGKYSIQKNSIIMRALEYVKSVNGVIINCPNDKSIARNGMIHEGKISATLGTEAIADIAESIQVERDLSLCRYTDSKIFIHNISSQHSVAKIRTAKSELKKQVKASVPYLNVLFDDSYIANFDANYKVLPPLRSEEDKQALLEGLRDGTIDSVSSNHVPIDVESKNLEFSRSAFGAIGLETCFSAMYSQPKGLTIRQLINIFAYKSRESLGLDIPVIDIGQKANLTIFHPEQKWIYRKNAIKSKSNNSPFINKEFTGKVIAVINNNKLLQF